MLLDLMQIDSLVHPQNFKDKFGKDIAIEYYNNDNSYKNYRQYDQFDDEIVFDLIFNRFHTFAEQNAVGSVHFVGQNLQIVDVDVKKWGRRDDCRYGLIHGLYSVQKLPAEGDVLVGRLHKGQKFGVGLHRALNNLVVDQNQLIG